MATTIDDVQYYAYDADAVFDMLTDDEFIDHVCRASGSVEVSASVEHDGDAVLVKSHRVLPAKIPGFAKRFVGDSIPLNETQHWVPVGDSGSRRAEFTVDFNGQPLAFSGSIVLAPDGDRSTVRTLGEIKCSVPLVGGRIEKLAKEWITKYLNKQQRVGNDWLAK